MTTQTSKVNIGTLIHGTLRSEDLIPAFTNELAYLSDGQHPLIDEINRFEWYSEDIRLDISEDQQEYASDLVNDLIDALNEYAPAHTYFGSIEGDGSDFGFWAEIGDSCEEHVQINSEDFICIDHQVHVNINDHGNITVSEIRGKEIWSAV